MKHKELIFSDEKLLAFLKRCKELKEKTTLVCYFGRHRYEIKRTELGFVLGESPSYRETEYTLVGTFKTVKQLQTVLENRPKMYAANVHSGELFSWQNWTNFLQAFKLYTQ